MADFFTPSESGTWRGRRRLTLPMVLDADLQTLSAGHRLQRAPDLYLLRLCAQDLAAWTDLTEALIANALLSGPWPREENCREREITRRMRKLSQFCVKTARETRSHTYT